MASTPGPDAHRDFDMTQSNQSWDAFQRLAKWVVVGCLVLLVGMCAFLTGPSPH